MTRMSALLERVTATDSATMEDLFTEDEWAAVDAGAVRAYTSRAAHLPAWLRGAGKGRGLDPAAEVRAIAYMWAVVTPHEIHARAAQPWKIRHQVALRVGEIVDDLASHAPEDPWLAMDEDGVVTHAADQQRVSSDDGGELMPKRFPPRYWSTRSPLETDHGLAIFDALGTLPPSDLWQFAVKGRDRHGAVWATAEDLAKLHTRRPSRAEYWCEMFNGDERRSLRKDLRKDTQLHENTVAAIAEDVVPAVAERFADEARPADYADVARERLRITSEEVQRVLLEKFDVLYED